MLARLQLHRLARPPAPHRLRRRPSRNDARLQRPPDAGAARRRRPRVRRPERRPAGGHAALVLVALTAALAACGGSHEPALTVGAVDDASKWAPDARSPMELARNAGLKTIVLSAVWKQGSSSATDLPPLRRAVLAAKAEGIEPQLAVYQLSSSTPLDDASRAAFSRYAVGLVRALPSVRTVLVGNEPNLNLF